MDNLIFIFILISFVVSFLVARHTMKVKEYITDSLRDKLDEIIREVNVEEHNNVTYWFDKENDRFLAQGTTIQEIREVLQQRFPKNIFVVNNEIFVGPDFTPVTLDNWRETLNGRFKENT